MKKGILYGIGTGPGEPELLTLKALRLIKGADVIAFPGKNKAETTVYKIVKPVFEQLDEKDYLELPTPMTKDMAVLEKSYTNAAQKIQDKLDKGLSVAYLTLGDPTVYSTYMYIHKILSDKGYETEIISGITSFCMAAAKLSTSLCERSEMLHIVPSSYDIDDALRLPGTKVLMKSASNMPLVKKKLIESQSDVYMVENGGMENESLCYSAEAINDKSSYFSVIIVK